MKVLFRQERSETIPVEEDFTCPSLQEDIEKTRYALEVAYAGFDELQTNFDFDRLLYL